MPRSRNIKPGFYENEELGSCSIHARYLFPALWQLADREGRLEDRPLRIKGYAFRYDSVDVEPLLAELQARGFILRYRNSDGSFIQILRFKEHQTPHYSEKASSIKEPELQESMPHQERRTPGAKTAASGTHGPKPPDNSGKNVALRGGRNPLNPESRILNPEEPPHPAGVSPLSSKPPNSRGKGQPKKLPLPEPFAVTERVQRWASEKGYAHLEEHLEAFVRKATANAYRYADWDAAFMEAIREDWAKLRGRGTNGAAPAGEHATTAASDVQRSADWLEEDRQHRAIVAQQRAARIATKAAQEAEP